MTPVPLSDRLQQLEEALAEFRPWRTVIASDGYPSTYSLDGKELADALLSGPLAPLIAKVRELEARISAGLALADELERPGSEAGRYLANRLRAALAGDPQ